MLKRLESIKISLICMSPNLMCLGLAWIALQLVRLMSVKVKEFLTSNSRDLIKLMINSFKQRILLIFKWCKSSVSTVSLIYLK